MSNDNSDTEKSEDADGSEFDDLLDRIDHSTEESPSEAVTPEDEESEQPPSDASTLSDSDEMTDEWDPVRDEVPEELQTGGDEALASLANSLDEDEIDEYEELDSLSETTFGDLLSRIEQGRPSEGTTKRPAPDPHDITALPRIVKADSILLVGPIGSEADDGACRSAVRLNPIAESRLMFVSLATTSPSQLSKFRKHSDEEPKMIASLQPGRTRASSSGPDMTTVRIRDPSDLKHLGISISKVLSEWEESGDPIHVCFYTLSELLRLVSEDRAFRFMHILLNRIEDAGGTVHVHLMAGESDREITGLFDQLFDATIEVTENDLQYLQRP